MKNSTLTTAVFDNDLLVLLFLLFFSFPTYKNQDKKSISYTTTIIKQYRLNTFPIPYKQLYHNLPCTRSFIRRRVQWTVETQVLRCRLTHIRKVKRTRIVIPWRRSLHVTYDTSLYTACIVRLTPIPTRIRRRSIQPYKLKSCHYVRQSHPIHIASC